MDKIIKPTIGRILHFYPSPDSPFHSSAPLVAIIAHVWGDTCINVAVFDPNGKPVLDPPTSIALIQPGCERPQALPFCEWTPVDIEGIELSIKLEKELVKFREETARFKNIIDGCQ